ncbi:hypothetical protein CFP56_038639 [Quercus suber]|uniref:DUF4220 domain-containing protein n=1 Tax=Quercus suber TaxID=58331 RepID=A0AAW0J1D8_QUESU
MAFWAPFMLLHLGGQDTITAYAVQDNVLWLRHLLSLFARSVVAIYVVRTSWKGNWLSSLPILMLFAGFIKYAERIWVMRSANRRPKLGQQQKYGELDSFPIFRPLFLNQKIGYKFQRKSREQFINYNSKKAFAVIEIELGHAYDTFYTKIPLFSTKLGYFFRFISFSTISFGFVFFLIKEWQNHLQIDLIITYLLFGGAVAIEIYAVILLITSDLGVRVLKKYIDIPRPKTNRCQLCKRRWSNSMGQFNMLRFCTRNKLETSQRTPRFFGVLEVWFFNQILPRLNGKLDMLRKLDMLHYKSDEKISEELKSLIWETYKEKSESQRPGFSEDYNSYISSDKNVQVEIYERIITWHLATDLCLYLDNENPEVDKLLRMIKHISDYLMYILTMCPSMLSTGNAEISFEKACERVRKALKNHPESSSLSLACEKITSYLSTKNKDYFLACDDEDPSDSLLVYNAFQVVENLRESGQKREILTRFWVENLAYVAILCEGKNHAKQLLKVSSGSQATNAPKAPKATWPTNVGVTKATSEPIQAPSKESKVAKEKEASKDKTAFQASISGQGQPPTTY